MRAVARDIDGATLVLAAAVAFAGAFAGCHKDCLHPPCPPGASFEDDQCRCVFMDAGAGVGGKTDAAVGDTADDSGGGGAADGAIGDGGGDAADGAEGAYACGAQSCSAAQICIIEYCGGGPINCLPAGDGGTCTGGWIYQDSNCPGTGPAGRSGPGCFPPHCVNPPPRCADRPAECGAILDCSCIPRDLCSIAHCANGSERTVICENA